MSIDVATNNMETVCAVIVNLLTTVLTQWKQHCNQYIMNYKATKIK